jgi:lysophospholipase L1-like esterase
MADALTLKPAVVVISFGINDAHNSITWASILSSLAIMKGLADAAGVAVILVEIIGWTDATDVEAARTRTYNANLSAWCAANHVSFVRTRGPTAGTVSALGLIRASTGYDDDCLVAISYDGTHLKSPGPEMMGLIMANYL